MCGIAGFIDLNLRAPAQRETLERMLQSILHRGPDEDGVLMDRSLAMGMRRLSIIDLVEGKQPIHDESGRFSVVFNGEIYNYRELRSDLISRGHRLTTQSDTETIVHLYEEHGPRCVDHLRGMFALAVWDRQRQELFIARDRLGIKPLYYCEVQGQLVFGSEIKALLEHPLVRPSLDVRAMSEYLSLKYVPSPRTMFAGIASLPPGHSLTVRDGQWSVRSYWDLSFEKPYPTKSDQEYEDEFLEVLRESIRVHLRSDVDFGAFLSGGLDSSTIVALMSEQLSAPVKTFSVGFGGPDDPDELPYAKAVADQFGCQHHTLKITGNDFLQLADDVLWHLDQPIADQATVATHMVAKLARQHVKMVLTGEGGDEILAGYARYVGEQYSPWLRWLPSWMGAGIRGLADRLPGLRRSKIALGALTISDEAKRFANWFPMFADDAKAELLSGQAEAIRAGAASNFAAALQRCDARSPLERMLYVDSKYWLPDYLLLRGDKLTMANSLEARVPLLDHHVVEFAASLPAHLKLRGSTRKYLLKRVAGRLLPDHIVHRKKQGFPIPIDRWLRKEARPWMRDLLSESSLQRRGFLNASFVQRLMKEHEGGYADHSTQLWGLMSLEMWMRRFMEAGPARSSRHASLPAGDGQPSSSAKERGAVSGLSRVPT